MQGRENQDDKKWMAKLSAVVDPVISISPWQAWGRMGRAGSVACWQDQHVRVLCGRSFLTGLFLWLQQEQTANGTSQSSLFQAPFHRAKLCYDLLVMTLTRYQLMYPDSWTLFTFFFSCWELFPAPFPCW